MAALDLGEFPLSNSRVPDAETQARSFLTKYPEADGRGIVVAVMDTGCDPGAPGLQLTAEGLPKIIDCVDCTGAGDVDTSTVVEASNGSFLSPHSGRQLTLGSGGAWTNPSGKWHVGVKKAFDLFDADLVKRVSGDQKKLWDESQRATAAEASRKLAEFVLENPKPQGETARVKKDLDERVAQLTAMQKDYEELGSILDVVAWHDGTNWRAVVGGREDGDLSGSPALTNFAIERKWASLGELEQMNYCLNIYDQGSVVSIVCDVGSHGTHVAGITAACHPDEPKRNGVAPGAQIVSLKIGDARLGSMETGTGLARAFAHCAKAKVDLMNLSFGEMASPAATGRVIDLARNTVEQHGIIFVTSAGNSGPALSTIGAPGNGADTFVTIGAHVSPPAMEAQYSMLEKVPATPYTWTSRGPTQDGSLGVTVCAPGSAITSIPNWTLSGAQLMNGTSMAAPNACGCLALVLSALKSAGAPWTPASVHRAAKASALPLPGADPFAVGAGMIQVDACYEYLMAHSSLPYRDVTVAAGVAGRGRGLYLREPHETVAPKVYSVGIQLRYKEMDPSLNRAKIDLELNVALSSSAPWVQVPPYMVLPAAGRSFNIKVDPTGLAAGQAHVAHVSGFDTARPNAGALFRVPVTVVRPLAPELCAAGQKPAVVRSTFRLVPGQIDRSFVAVPPGCTWAEVTVTTKPFDGQSRMLILHLHQDLQNVPASKTSQEHMLQFGVAGAQKRTCRVEANGTLEICLAQNWSSLGHTEVEYEAFFHGVTPDANMVTLSSGSPVACTHVVSGPGAVAIKPSASLGVHRTSARPTSAVVQPCGDRDLYPEGRQVYELVLEYSFEMVEDGEVTPQALLLNDKLYESIYESQMLMVYNAGKRLVGCTDAWPAPIKLKKGDYVARLQVRHDETSLLERLKTLPLCIDRKLEKEIQVKAFSDYNSAIASKDEFKEIQVKGSVRNTVFFAVAVDEKLPDSVKQGDFLLGSVTYGEPALKSAGKFSRGGFGIQFAVTVPKPVEKKDDDKDVEDPRTNAEKLAHAVRDTQIKHLESLRKWPSREEHATLLEELLKSNSGHLPLYQERILALEEFKNPDKDIALKEEPDRLIRVVEAADALLAEVDMGALTAHLGRRVDKDDAEAARKAKEMESAKEAVIDALAHKVRALAKCGLIAEGGLSEDRRAELSRAFKEFGSLVEVAEAKHGRTTAAYERSVGRHGAALAALTKYIGAEKAPGRALLEERAELLDAMGWKAWAEQERKGFIVKYPKAYARF